MKFVTHVMKYTNRCKSNQLFQSRRLFATNTSESIESEYKPMATALSDFLSPSPYEIHQSKTSDVTIEYKPMATAISDILSPSEFEQKQSDIHKERLSWSNRLSFTSPEADFVSASFDVNEKVKGSDYDEDMADVEILKSVVHVRNEEASLNLHHDIFDNDELRQSTVYSLSFATPESDFTSAFMTEQMKNQLKQVEEVGPEKFKTYPLHLRNKYNGKLPKTFHEEALLVSSDALVVTETVAPYRIVAVNPAWEKLCGYTQEECTGKTLNILQGPETDKAAITGLLSHIFRGEEAGMEVINYDKNGRKFLNRLTMGSLRNEKNDITHFIGLLQEVEKSNQWKQYA